MSRRYTPDGEALVNILAGRVDALDTGLQQITGDVAAIGRGLTDLTVQIRQLSTPGGAGSLDEPAALIEVEEEAGQLDWFAVDQSDHALNIITGLTGWSDTVLCHLGIALPVPCWPMHPSVVVDLIALDAERAAAYAGPKPTAVSEFLARWLPGTRDRITTALAACAAERGHRFNGRTYDTTGFDPLSAAAWWATDRDVPAHEAFGLTQLT